MRSRRPLFLSSGGGVLCMPSQHPVRVSPWRRMPADWPLVRVLVRVFLVRVFLVRQPRLERSSSCCHLCLDLFVQERRQLCASHLLDSEQMICEGEYHVPPLVQNPPCNVGGLSHQFKTVGLCNLNRGGFELLDGIFCWIRGAKSERGTKNVFNKRILLCLKCYIVIVCCGMPNSDIFTVTALLPVQ